jgi:uncharacterized protein YbjQ (UPF0145 family)
MMKPRRILLSTTTLLEGWTIHEYLGPVSAEVVIGTSILTDFFSSWSDLFGLQSLAYQSKLDQIKSKALAGIEYKALRLGANAVLGLRVDHDEISAGGKSLLMVTAMGTAVRATGPARADGEDGTGRAGAVSSYELNTQRHRLRLIREAEAGRLNLVDPKVWAFVLDNQVEELAPYVMERVATVGREFAYSPADRDRAWSEFKQFFLRLAPESAAGHLYAALARSDAETEFALQVIREAGLLDVPRVMAMLHDENPLVRARGLQVVRADPPFYTAEDLPLLDALRRDISASLPPAAVSVKRGLLGEKEVWSCICGEPVDAKASECHSCRRDRYGIPQGWLNPPAAVQLLTERIDLLQPRLAG